MKTQLLIVVGLLFFLPNLFSQENSFHNYHFKDKLLSQRKHYLPHVQLNEMGNYFVDMEFYNPINDRSDKPVLDSTIYTVVNTLGDTTYRRIQYYTISPDNRIQRIEYEEYDTYGDTVELKKSYSEYFYENQGDSLVHQITTYIFNDFGQPIPSENYVLIFDEEGIASSFLWQFYEIDTWENFLFETFENNEYGCPLFYFQYSWANNAWYLRYKDIGTCEEELLIKQLYYFSFDFGETEIHTGYQSYEYDENRNLKLRSSFSPSQLDPDIYEENYLYVYNYNEENLLDNVEYFKWDTTINEFRNDYYYTLAYDEIQNTIKTEYFKYNNSNNLELRSQTFTEYDNNYLKGEYINGNDFSTSKSMPLRYTWYPIGANSHDTQYFYSTGSVSSTEQTSNINFEIFPNPTSGELNINISDILDSNSNIVIRNSTGSIVWSEMANSRNSLNVGHLPSGMYFISLDGNNSRSEIKKFVKF